MDGTHMALSIGKFMLRELGRPSLREALVKAIAKREDGISLPAGGKRRLLEVLSTAEAQEALFEQSEAGTQRLAEMIRSDVLGPEAPAGESSQVSTDSNRMAQLLVAELLGVLGLGPAFATIAYKLRQIDSSIAAGFAGLAAERGNRDASQETPIVADVTQGISYRPAQNGLAILRAYDLEPDDLAEMCNEINGFADALTAIPDGPRSLLALVVSRGEELSPHGIYMGHWSNPWTPAFKIRISVLKNLATNRRNVNGYAEVLEQAGLLKIDEEPFDETPLYIVGTPNIEWTFLNDLRRLAAGDQSVISRVLVDLDFVALDL
jgi:hypothetical protein